MTVLLMLLFIILALAADKLVRVYREHKVRIRATVNAVGVAVNEVVQDIFEHDNGLLPTMADGGQKIEKKEEGKN